MRVLTICMCLIDLKTLLPTCFMIARKILRRGNALKNIYFGASEFRDSPNKKPIRGVVLYCDSETGANYQEPVEIDFEKYGTIFTVNTPTDDLHEDLKRQEVILEKLVKAVKDLKEKAIDNTEETST